LQPVLLSWANLKPMTPTTSQRLVLILVLLTCTSVYSQKKQTVPYYPDASTWEKRAPETVGINASALQEAVRFAIENETNASRDLKQAHYLSAFGREPFGFPVGPLKERGDASGVIIRNGFIVAEWGTPQRVDLTFSVAKSFLSTVVGLAVQEGLIKSIHDKVYETMAPIIPYELSKTGANKADALGQADVIEIFATDHNKKITWDHLLRQTSDWEGTLWGKPDWADRPEGPSADWQTRKRNEPGTVYKYNDTRVNVLALATLNTWRRPLPQVLKEKVMDPIGASTTWRWTGYENSWVVMDGVLVQSVSGGSHWGGGMFINAYDQARFGYLTLRNGKWKDKQIVPESWINLSQTPGSANKNYGFMNYFLNPDRTQYPSAPATAFAHIGAGTNMIYVDRENDLVIVARWIDNRALDGLIDRVIKSIEKK
jgi:CubicO group peptidase (beta-lactamase class C family)